MYILRREVLKVHSLIPEFAYHTSSSGERTRQAAQLHAFQINCYLRSVAPEAELNMASARDPQCGGIRAPHFNEENVHTMVIHHCAI